MVYWTTVRQHGGVSLTETYHNEVYRTKHGFKEMHPHNPPPRKNKDFKPVLYGDFIGMLNFKLSEPWTLMRHFNDLLNESHHMPIKWIREAVKGAIYGAFLGH